MRALIQNKKAKPMNYRSTSRVDSQAGMGLIAHYILKNTEKAENGDVSISLNMYKASAF